MRNNIVRVLLTCALMVAFVGASLSAQDVESLKYPKLNEIKIPDIEKVTLDNGMRLYLLEDKSLPLFEVRVRIAGGEYLDPPDKIGLGAICGNVMRTGGTERWSGDELDELLEGIGGSVETNVDITQGSARVNILSEYTDLGLDVLAEVLRRPRFDEDKIDLAKVQARSGISRRNDDISGIALREYRKLIFGADSPHARHTEYATIDAITRDDLIAFHKLMVQPQNIQMAVIGDFEKEAILEAIKQRFADWPKSETPIPPLPEVEYDWRHKVYYVEKPDAAQTYIRIGHIGGQATDPDYADRLVMSAVFGEGFGSRLTNNVRVKGGMAYSVNGRFNAFFGYPGYLFAVASTQPENTVKATKLMIEQFESMLTVPPTETEMQKGRDGYLNSFVFNFDSKSEVVNRMMTYDLFGVPQDFLQKVKERVENVTPEDVMTAAKNNIHPDQLVVLIVGNDDNFDEPLEALGMGPAEEIDITIPSGEEKVELVIDDETLARGREILSLGAEAQGGIDGFKGIKSTEVKGTFTIVTPQGELPISIHEINLLPDHSKSVIIAMGRELVDVTTGDSGWKTTMTGDIEDKTAEDLASESRKNKRGTIEIFQHCDDPEYRAVSAGEGAVNDIAVEFVVILDENDESLCKMGFNKETHQLVSKSYWDQTMMGEGNIEEIYSDFQETGGVLMPMSNEQTLNGQPLAKVAFTSYVLNPEVAPGTFDKPE